MKIVIETIPHQDQRYTTVGDWFSDPDGTLHIKVSELSDWRREALIAVHELVEVLLCKNAGILQVDVDKFDKNWKPHDGIEEPGDDPEAPYENQHNMAMGIEQTLAAAFGIKWHDYEKELDELPEVEPKP